MHFHILVTDSSRHRSGLSYFLARKLICVDCHYFATHSAEREPNYLNLLVE